MNVAADSNVLVALLDPANSTHERSLDLIVALDPATPIYLHPLNLAEVLSFYGSAVEREAKWKALGEIAPFKLAVTDDAAAEALQLAEIRHVTGAKMPDVCALRAAVAMRCDALLSHDRRLVARGRRIGILVVSDAAELRPREDE